MLKFNEQNHEYTLDGKQLISVTQLLAKHNLSTNYDNVPTKVLKAKAERGTLIHEEIENWIKKKEIGFTEETYAFAKYITSHKIKCEESEYMVNNDILAGTIDLLLSQKGQKINADIKTTAKLNVESVAWQLSLYLWLLLECDNKTPNENWDGYKAQAYHFDNDGVLSVVDIQLKPVEDIKKLLDCEREGRKYECELKVGENVVATIVQLEDYIQCLNKKLELAKKQSENLKSALLEEMESRGIKSIENDNIKITYVPEQTRISLDTKAIKENHPRIYKKYSKETKVKPSIRITLKGEKEV